MADTSVCTGIVYMYMHICRLEIYYNVRQVCVLQPAIFL